MKRMTTNVCPSGHSQCLVRTHPLSNMTSLCSLDRLGKRVDQIGNLMTKLEPIWSTNLVKNSIWSTHLVNQQYPPIWSSNLVKFNLVRIDHTGSDKGQSGQTNLVNQTNMVKPIWSTRPIWSVPPCQPDQSGQWTWPIWRWNFTNLVNQVARIANLVTILYSHTQDPIFINLIVGDKTQPIWSIESHHTTQYWDIHWIIRVNLCRQKAGMSMSKPQLVRLHGVYCSVPDVPTPSPLNRNRTSNTNGHWDWSVHHAKRHGGYAVNAQTKGYTWQKTCNYPDTIKNSIKQK